MGVTRTDTASILASLGGLAIAAIGILSEPLVVDSSRPYVQNINSDSKSDNADARLWDDPFAPFPNNQNPELVSPSIHEFNNTLVLVVPVNTQRYEEDRESRLRVRFAVQRALLDGGYAPIRASVLRRLTLHFSGKEPKPYSFPSNPIRTSMGDRAQPALPVLLERKALQTNGIDPGGNSDCVTAPAQFFELQPVNKKRGTSQFLSVVVVWLPDSVLWKDGYRSDVFNKIDCQLVPPCLPGRAQHDLQQSKRTYVMLGPWDSDELASLEAASNRGKSEIIETPANCSGWIVSYRATVAQALLNRLIDQPVEISDSPQPGWASSDGGVIQTNRGVYRLKTNDELLCRALLEEAAARGSLPFHPKQVRILVFSEWDTLYGRSLVETLRALANSDDKLDTRNSIYYHDLRKDLIAQNPDLGKPYTREGQDPSFNITVVPYLRGLDGASTLYSQAYPHLSQADTTKDDTHKERTVEPPEGTTQFDYLRRSTSNILQQPVPFIPSGDRPDAIVIFGSDVYDKLILLKFLKQTLRNCLYMTTDLDALYWHPHYLQYTKDLIVASAFPLEMQSSACSLDGPDGLSLTAKIRFRDTYQSAAYWSVIRILEAKDDSIEKSICDFSAPVATFRIGNSEPLQVAGDKPLGTENQKNALSIAERNLIAINGSLETIFRPIIQGVSPFWPILIQCIVIGLASIALLHDIPDRTRLPLAAGDQFWEVASSLLPSAHCLEAVSALRANIREKWWSTRKVRDRNGDRNFYRENPPAPEISYPTSERKDCDQKDFSCGAIIKHFQARLNTATTKAAVARIGLSLLSTIFNLRTTTTKKDSAVLSKTAEIVDQRGWNKELLPIVNYIESEFHVLPNPPAKDVSPADAVHPWVQKAWTLLSPLFPSKIFFFVSLVGLVLIAAICLQPEVYLIGPETRTPGWRIIRWLIETLAFLFSFGVFYRVCFEQSRFRRLISSFSDLIANPQTSLSNRRIVVILSDASDAITHLSFTPCALAFLLFLSHMRPLGGVPMTVEISVLLVFGLAVLSWSFFSLRSRAISERNAVRRSYEEDVVITTRLIMRLNSFATAEGPLQDSTLSLVKDIKGLIEKNSNAPLPEWFDRVIHGVGKRSLRDSLCTYLESCRERYKEIINRLDESNDGVFGPLLSSPMLTALLIPVGGAGGISLLAWLLTLAR